MLSTYITAIIKNMDEIKTPQMVAINGERVRRLREARGLTQLYLATVVEVTTDTVSRWENGRYRTIRRENAHRLAQALEVEIGAIIGVDPTGDIRPREKGFSPWTVAILAGFVLILGLVYFFGRRQHIFLPGEIEAQRLLPQSGPPGGVVPLVLRLSGIDRGSLIVEEVMPEGVALVAAEPRPRVRGQSLRWLVALAGKPLRLSCLVRLPVGPAKLRFRGLVRMRGKWLPVGGKNRIAIAPFHWADVNHDLKIDDDEILAAYEMLGEQQFFARQRNLLDDLWAADGYRRRGHDFIAAAVENPAENHPAAKQP